MATSDDGRSITELRRMDEATARDTLTVNEYERWEKLQDLHEQADETREQWDEEEATVTDIAVHADMEQLGTELDLYGNDVLVHVDSEDPDLEAAANQLDDALGDHDPEDVAEISEADQREALDAIVEMLDCVLVRWNDTEWDSLTDAQRGDVLAQCRTAWGAEAMLLAWLDILAAVKDEQEEKVSVIDSFRQSKRRGRR